MASCSLYVSIGESVTFFLNFFPFFRAIILMVGFPFIANFIYIFFVMMDSTFRLEFMCIYFTV